MANQPKKYKKFVATAATATLVASAIVPVASAKSFSDVAETSEFQPFIDALSDSGIINGYADGTFKPGNKLTRGQVVKMLGRWVESNGQEVPSDWNSKQRFNDVPVNSADEELVKYAALVKDAGVFSGSNGNLKAGNNITRQQMAKVLNGAYEAVNGVSLVELAENIDDKLIQDLSTSQQEFEGYIQALVDLEISTVSVFRPSENVTRAQFAKFLYNTINLDAAVSASVRAINNTTVEVTFKDVIDNIKDIDFAIEGLEVKNAVVKQTDKYTAVLTTAAQEAGKEYTVTVDGEEVGSFTGIAAVIPTKVTTTTTSLQGVIGNQVTLKAEVAVADGQSKEGIPVTFNIVNNSNNVNDKIEVEVLTNAEGVATYSYTRYYTSEDKVTAYATSKSSIYDNAKVYWDNKIQLAVSEITTGNDLANETKKSYKVTGEKNKTYYVAIKENLNVTPDQFEKQKVYVQNHNSSNFVTPYELTTGGTQFATVKTNASGEATFTVYGSNLSATPIVYDPETTPESTSATTAEKLKYNKLDLQAQAPTVKFSQIDRLALAVVAEGTADAAQYAQVPVAYDSNSAGGRTYTVTVTDKDGKLAPEGTVAYVKFEKDNMSGDNIYFSTAKNNFVKVAVDSIHSITVGKEGKAQFRVAGTGATAFVKPTVFLNTAGDVTPVKLDKADVQQVADATYFKSPVVANAILTVKDKNDRIITSLNAGEDAYFTYQSVDQNGFPYRPTTTTGETTTTVWVPYPLSDGTYGYKQETVTVPGGTSVTSYTLAFDVTSTFGNAEVKNIDGSILQAVQNLGKTRTYNLKSDANGKAIVRITSESADTVSVNVTGASNILPTQTASVSFVNSTIVPDSYSGIVQNYNSKEGKLTFQGKKPVDIYGSNIIYSNNNQVVANYEAFIKLLEDANGPVSITRIVKDGVTSFNIYNIATTGGGPVDVSKTISGEVALTNAKAAAATLDRTKYTVASLTSVDTAVVVANALPATATDAEKAAAAKAITDAIAALVPVTTNPGTPEGVTITTFTATTANSITEALGIFTAYAVEGTVAGAITSVELIYTLEDGTEVARTVTVTDGKFTDALPTSTGTVKSVKAKSGTIVTADKAVTVVKP